LYSILVVWTTNSAPSNRRPGAGRMRRLKPVAVREGQGDFHGGKPTSLQLFFAPEKCGLST